MRWSREPMDADYLDRLTEGVQPDGDLVASVFRFSEGDLEGEVAIWQVQVRGDDMLEVLRLARLGLASTEGESR